MSKLCTHNFTRLFCRSRKGPWKSSAMKTGGRKNPRSPLENLHFLILKRWKCLAWLMALSCSGYWPLYKGKNAPILCTVQYREIVSRFGCLLVMVDILKGGRHLEFINVAQTMVFCFQNCSYLSIVRKKCSSDREKLLRFETEGREFSKVLRSLEQFIRTVKGRNNFW